MNPETLSAKGLLREGETLDALFGGRLYFIQSKRGYRFSVDALLLAGLSGASGARRVVDLGCGTGVVGIILAGLGLVDTVVGVEIQAGLSDMAQRNVAINGLEERVKIVRADLRDADIGLEPGSFDLALANPPFREPDSGRVNPDEERALARHEIVGSLQDFLLAAGRLLEAGAGFSAIYPARRLAHAAMAARDAGFELKTLWPIFSRPDEPGRLFVFTATKGGSPGVELMPPFYIYGRSGEYSGEMETFLRGEMG